jgi:23S rRNA pseudouridine1911/1915/1917 synthase
VSDIDCITVDPRGAGQRLDRYLSAQVKWGSRSHVQRLIAAGCVHVEGRCAKPGTIVRAGQTIEVREGLPAVPAGVEAEAIPLEVLYEDEYVMVINKPAGMVVHPAPGHWQGTLVSALLHHWQGPPPGLDPARPGIVHRLDKDTSGVLLIAKDPATLADLGAQFRRREVEKQYVAFVWGHLRPATGTISEPIGRNPAHRMRMAVRRGGREAQTRFQVLEHFGEMTLVRLWPRTGRTHQLRVHLAAMGHPILGDAVYGGVRARRGRPLIARQALHAEKITFRHPSTHALLSFTAPLPADMLALWHVHGGAGARAQLDNIWGFH